VNGVLAGKVLLCTGGGSGIGRGAVEAFLDQGAKVGVLELDAQKGADLEQVGGDLIVHRGDATSYVDTVSLLEDILHRWGRLDGAATFVGIFDHYRRLEDIAPIDLAGAFDEIFSVNVRSVLVTAAVALPELRRSNGSLTLTLSSSSFYPGRGGTLYVASKFALRGVMTALAYEAAPDVRVNAVAPGGTLDTDLRGAVALGQADERLADHPGRREQLEARTPLHIALTPAHHAGAYVFLASDAASGITGEIIRSDGGLSVR
jgi:NAD(P)-dependent dehydrogenase (short-subunit alcohol dehydrogenase family)